MPEKLGYFAGQLLCRPLATGLRNPTALTIQPGTGQLWAVVNERDEIGPNLVPDYLTAVRDGAFYGWPYSDWGQHVHRRVQPQNPQMVASAIRPDYGLGSHVAALGLAFSSPALGSRFAEGVFIGEHGSWNRSRPAGYKVVFVPFLDGRPVGPPVDVVTGFQSADGRTRGRPVGVTVDPRGALITRRSRPFARSASPIGEGGSIKVTAAVVPHLERSCLASADTIVAKQPTSSTTQSFACQKEQ